MVYSRKDLLRAVREELTGALVEAETYGEDNVGLTVLWDGFAPMDDDARQKAVREAVVRRLGEEGAGQVAFVIAWTPAEKKQFDIDKL